ncbi:MAG: metal-dependent transcriptional regulator [Candidatus Krumholzibacteriota bacterium]|nr:metal-dependent transcriptional regulator [Candidatus Krumholzibacteriota bacterium]
MSRPVVEDYLKQIYLAQEKKGRDRVATGALAETLAVTPGTVTGMLKSLAAEGLVDYAPYGGARLTARGSRLARAVLRRHRLVETFLVAVMGLDWSEVHTEAETLEHAVSERLLVRMDEMLGQPATDPHGQTIPRAGENPRPTPTLGLDEAVVARPLRLVRVDDETPDFLRLLARHGIHPGCRLVVAARDQAAGTVHARAPRGVLTLGLAAAARLRVLEKP